MEKLNPIIPMQKNIRQSEINSSLYNPLAHIQISTLLSLCNITPDYQDSNLDPFIRIKIFKSMPYYLHGKILPYYPTQ